jgi:hypothetical protein
VTISLLPGIAGKAPMVGAKLPHADAARLARLAPRQSLTISEALRACVRLGLDQLEPQDGGAPDEGG